MGSSMRSAARTLSIDALRAFVTVVQSRGFTRAAEQLGRTQPTISLQVKRLEELLDASLFENSTRLTLSKAGEVCFAEGVKLLQIHDDMIARVTRQTKRLSLSLGAPSEIANPVLTAMTQAARQEDMDMTFDLVCAESPMLMREFRAERLGVALAFPSQHELQGAARRWKLPLTWACSPKFRLRDDSIVPLVACGEGSPYFAAAVSALSAARRGFEIVCTAADYSGLEAAVVSGIGVSPLLKSAVGQGLIEIDCLSSYKLPWLDVGLFINEKHATASMANFIASAVARLSMLENQPR